MKKGLERDREKSEKGIERHKERNKRVGKENSLRIERRERELEKKR